MKINLSPKELQVLVVPLISLVVIIGLAFGGGKLAWERIGSLRSELSSAQKLEESLGEKLSILQGLGGVVADFSAFSLIALPAENSTLAAISQIRSQAGITGVTIEEIKVGGEVKDKSGLSKTEINFTAISSLETLSSFLTFLTGSSPLGKVSNLGLSQAEAATRATVVYTVFWAPLPERIPSVTESVQALSETEMNILDILSSLRQPAFANLTAQPPGQRSDPFAF